jgi:hypothetical protein
MLGQVTHSSARLIDRRSYAIENDLSSAQQGSNLVYDERKMSVPLVIVTSRSQ